MGNKEEKTKEELILAEERRLKKIFRFLDQDRKKFAEKLCKKVAFMDVTLNELQDTVTAEGYIIDTVNGNGFRVKAENPAAKSYNTMIKNYSSVVKQLLELLPEGSAEADELMQWVRGRKK